MKKLMVIADDLTGACDTGIKFREHGYHTRVVMPTADVKVYRDENIDVFSVTTNTRNLYAEDAYKTVNRLLDFCDGNYRFYKKIDSVLRGNIIAELDAFIDGGYADNAIICSTYVEEGRTIQNGILHIRKNDEEVKISVVEKLGLEKYGYIKLSTVREGYLSVIDEIKKNKERYIIVDSTTHEDLLTVARVCELLPRTVPAGSAGLASQYCHRLFQKKQISEETLNHDGIPLIIIGTRNPVTVRQVQKLKTLDLEVHIINIDQNGLIASEAVILEKKENKKGILLTTSPIYFNVGNTDYLISQNCSNDYVMDFISSEAQKIYQNNKISGIVASGGDICSSVLTALGKNKIDLVEEILPGIVAGQASGYEDHKIRMITKSGGFGDEDVLIKLFEYIERV